MGKCVTMIRRVEFDVTDTQVTTVTVEIDFAGDCPIQLKRVYRKVFPARHSMVDLLTMPGGVTSYLEWD